MAVCPNCQQPIQRVSMGFDQAKQRTVETFSCNTDSCTVEFINVYVKK
ncbi:hypothetical protein KAR91_72145 [Candidatus Pacearchaeota archaeon]|nr:hypothetical protein [Candidatus Pacearchaeota archaeon]